jgi:glycosyltransferase involved in cell wall biosynthesis
MKNFKIVCFGVEQFNYDEIQLFNKSKIVDQIIFKTGDDLKLENYYRKASLFVTTSLLEGFGLTPLEAMRCGCPVIASDIPIFRETLGNSCVYANTKNVSDITKMIESTLKSKNTQKRLIKRGYKRIKKFSWDKCTLETAKLYRQLAST